MNKASLKINICRLAITLTSFSIFSFLACGGGEDNSESGLTPCDITTPAVIQSFFGGQVSDGVPGNARDCEYDVTNATISQVSTVFVYLFSIDAASEWDTCKAGYDYRGGTTDITIFTIGDAAFYPSDVGMNEIIVRKGSIIFAVGSYAIPADTIRWTPTRQLATSIANSL